MAIVVILVVIGAGNILRTPFRKHTKKRDAALLCCGGIFWSTSNRKHWSKDTTRWLPSKYIYGSTVPAFLSSVVQRHLKPLKTQRNHHQKHTRTFSKFIILPYYTSNPPPPKIQHIIKSIGLGETYFPPADHSTTNLLFKSKLLHLLLLLLELPPWIDSSCDRIRVI